jgi:hypothetical protein
MSATHRRLISFAGSTIAVEYNGARMAALIDFLYRYVPADGDDDDDDDDAPPHVTYRMVPSGQSGRMVLYRDDTLLYEGNSEPALADLLLGDSCHHLAERSRGGPLFHAAGLAWQGQGLLLPGGIGAGKTTLAAWLVARGLDYLTDELVFVPHRADAMQTLTRPLNVKHTSRPALRSHFDFEGHAAHIVSTPHTDLIPPTLLKPTNTLSEPPVSLIIFPHYLPGGDLSWRPLSKAQAGLALMECLVNARNLPDHGFSEIARLARQAPAYHVCYAGFDQIEERIEALLQSCQNNLAD